LPLFFRVGQMLLARHRSLADRDEKQHY